MYILYHKTISGCIWNLQMFELDLQAEAGIEIDYVTLFWRIPDQVLTLWRVGNPTDEHQAICTVFIDQEEEGTVHSEVDLGGERHKAHLRQSSSLCPLLVHRDGSLVFQLWREKMRQEFQTLLHWLPMLNLRVLGLPSSLKPFQRSFQRNPHCPWTCQWGRAPAGFQSNRNSAPVWIGVSPPLLSWRQMGSAMLCLQAIYSLGESGWPVGHVFEPLADNSRGNLLLQGSHASDLPW